MNILGVSGRDTTNKRELGFPASGRQLHPQRLGLEQRGR